MNTQDHLDETGALEPQLPPPLDPKDATPENPFRLGVEAPGKVRAETRRFIAKLPSALRSAASATASQYFTAPDQIAAIRQRFALPAPASRRRKAEAQKVLSAELAQAQLRAAADAARVHHASMGLPQTFDDALAGKLPESGPNVALLHAGTLYALGLRRPDATGLYLVEMQRGTACDAWKLEPGDRKPGFWARIRIFFQLLKLVFRLPDPRTLSEVPQEPEVKIAGRAVAPGEMAILRSMFPADSQQELESRIGISILAANRRDGVSGPANNPAADIQATVNAAVVLQELKQEVKKELTRG